MQLFEKADIPHAPLHDLDSLIDDPHLAAVGLIQSIDHPTEGRLHVAGPAATWSKTPPSIRQYPPRLGEHGEEILRSEERRVGKECRSRWARYPAKNKEDDGESDVTSGSLERALGG